MKTRLSQIYARNKKTLWVLGALLVIAFPFIVTKESILTIAVLILIYMILASGLNVTNGYIGLFNVGMAGFMCIGAYTTALLVTRLNAGFFTALLASAVVTSVIGALFALPTNRFSGLYFAITTMGFSEIVRLIALNWLSLTNGPNGIMNIKRPQILGVDFRSAQQFYFLVLVILALVVAGIYRVLTSRVGRAWISIRENPDAANSLGVKIAAYKSLNFLVMGFVAGIGGSLLAYYYGYISSDMFMMDNGHEILAMVMVGGTGSLSGPIVGAFLLTLGMQLFRSVAQYRMIAYALMLMAMMWLRPQGIVGATNTVMAQKTAFHRKRKKGAKKARETEVNG